MTTLREHIERVQLAEAHAAVVADEAKRLRALLQFACPHEHVIEATHRDTFVVASLPFRVCTDCGFAEDGWPCDYQVLTAEPEQENVPRDEVRQLVHGLRHANSEFVGHRLDVRAAGGAAAYKRAALLRVLGLTEAEVSA